LTSSADIAQLRAVNTATTGAVQRDLRGYFGTLNLAKPEAVRDALRLYVPILVAKYGAAASTLAADWYEQTRARNVAGGYRALTAPPVADEILVASVRFGAQHLFTDNPGQTLLYLAGVVQKQTWNPARATIVSNTVRDPAKPGWARVPKGAQTCAFCAMLASRGFVYGSKQSAEFRQSDGDKYHDHCNCEAIPVWGKHPLLENYDPGHYRKLYEAGTGGTTTNT
jgi:hypothetical protein